MKYLMNEKGIGKRTLLLMIYDAAIVNFASIMALMLRFDFHYGSIPDIYFEGFISYATINTILTIIIFYFSSMYRSLWAYASINELWHAAWGCVIAILTEFVGMTIAGLRMPYSYYPLSFFVMFAFAASARFFYRFVRFLRNERHFRGKTDNVKNVMIIGGGEACRLILNEIRDSSHTDYNVKCIIDDDSAKKGRYIGGIRIVGDRSMITKYAEEYSVDIIMFAIPTIAPQEQRDILEICQETECEIRILPGVYELVNGEASISKMRKVNISDLLGREQVKISNTEVADYVKDRVVLVTGGGGSIGSELCRQIAAHSPRTLIIFDIYENNAYDIQQELKTEYPNLNLKVLIGSVRNTHRINEVFELYHPDIVYHAAAHKHVPLMEDSPNEAIKNNVFGTYKTAKAAIVNGTKKFVLISTDKAVNPTNIMGASKRLCEMIVQMFDRESDTEFVAVRFGNVLGSNGSVIPLFTKQIEAGGPVTVTHRDIIRYFMTIPEAVSLVLIAGAYAHGGEIFVLDMGEPVRIDDLARKMIRLSGYTPDVDIKIEYTGLRPGEKLYEEMLMQEEGLKHTANDKIFIGRPIELNNDRFKQQLAELKTACERDDESIKYAVSRIVSTYQVGRAVSYRKSG